MVTAFSGEACRGLMTTKQVAGVMLVALGRAKITAPCDFLRDLVAR